MVQKRKKKEAYNSLEEKKDLMSNFSPMVQVFMDGLVNQTESGWGLSETVLSWNATGSWAVSSAFCVFLSSFFSFARVYTRFLCKLIMY